MFIKIFRIDKNIPLPKYETEGSFAFDFLVRKKNEIEPNSLALIPSNVIIKCPKNLALFILPRSSTFRKKNLIFPHSVGLIDQDYCGEKDEIMIQVFNFGKNKIVIEKGEKIAQGIFLETEKIKFKEIFEINNFSRGGFGSTDQKK